MTEEERAEQIREALFSNDIASLQELARCGCCCDEHYFLGCPAHIWMGCRGSYAPDRLEREEQLKAILDS